MDEQGSRTMFLGLIASFLIYGASFVVPVLWKDDRARLASIALIVVSIAFLGGWYLAVRGGFRVGRPPTRANRRAKMHAQKEKEKRARMR